MQTDNPSLQAKKETVNSLVHGLGVLFGIIGLPFLLIPAVEADSTNKIIGALVYGVSFLLVFTFSTVYHGLRGRKWKRLFLILDHIGIYFLIAGTYTPLVLIYQHNRFGLTLLAVLWGLTLLGSVFKIFFCGRWEILSTIVYMMMGWSLLSGGVSFFAPMPLPVLVLVIAGGALYSLGVIFYVWERYTYSHAVWHSFVLVAAVCHYAAILLSV